MTEAEEGQHDSHQHPRSLHLARVLECVQQPGGFQRAPVTKRLGPGKSAGPPEGVQLVDASPGAARHLLFSTLGMDSVGDACSIEGGCSSAKGWQSQDTVPRRSGGSGQTLE